MADWDPKEADHRSRSEVGGGSRVKQQKLPGPHYLNAPVSFDIKQMSVT
jgi:hypothetical protein